MIISLSILIEAVVEYIKSLMKMFTEKDYKTAVTQICAIMLSVIICFSAGADLFKGVINFKDPVGKILTGIIISRGANYVSDLLSKLK